jgi:hypothetical protein
VPVPTAGQEPCELTARVVCAPRPWAAYVVPVSGFPLAEKDVEPLRRWLGQLTNAAAKRWSLFSEVFLQITQIHIGNGERRLPLYGRQWIPETGLGVWPDREPPALWTMDEVIRTKVGERMRPLQHLVLRVTTSKEARESARNVMLDIGCVLEIMTPEGTNVLLQKAKELLLPSITEIAFQNFPFYVPLLDCKSLEKATAPELERWFCGASIYVRESFEDRGVLIASCQHLTPIFEQLGGQFEEGPEPLWRIPIKQVL